MREEKPINDPQHYAGNRINFVGESSNKFHGLKRQCPVCAKIFNPAHDRHTYCRPRCQKDAHNLKRRMRTKKNRVPLLQCQYCKKMFACNETGAKKKYCSIQCRLLTRYELIKKGIRENRSQKRCGCCGKEFMPNIKNPNQEYCCSECRIVAEINRRKVKRWAGRQLKQCQWCGKLFMPKTSHKKIKYCNRKCKDFGYSRYRRELKLGNGEQQ